jgi:transcription antitermination factor NusA-like protein
VQTQLCEFCLKSGMLCSKCQEKIRKGLVNNLYIKTAQLLLDVEDQFPLLQKAKLVNVVEAGGYLVLIVGQGDRAKFLSYGGRLSKLIRDGLHKQNILILEEGINDRRFIEDLFSNQQIVTINIIWLPDGSTETRVVLTGRGKELSKKRIRALSEAAKRIRNMNLRIEYVKPRPNF